MSDLALIANGVVVAVARATSEAAVFGPDPAGAVVSFEPEDGVCAGMLWDGEALSTPASAFEEQRAAALAAIRQRRWVAETGGIVVGGTPIRTDERSQAKLNGAVSLLQLDPSRTAIEDWEAQPGVFVDLPRETVQAIGLAVGNHIQACFTRSRELTELVAAAADEAALAAIDLEAGWPA